MRLDYTIKDIIVRFAGGQYRRCEKSKRYAAAQVPGICASDSIYPLCLLAKNVSVLYLYYGITKDWRYHWLKALDDVSNELRLIRVVWKTCLSISGGRL